MFENLWTVIWDWIVWNPNLFAAICWFGALAVLVYLSLTAPQADEHYDDDY